MQRRESPLVGRVHDGVEFDEKRGYIQMPITGSIMQRNKPTLVLGIHVRPVIQQKFGHLHIVVTSYTKQRKQLIKKIVMGHDTTLKFHFYIYKCYHTSNKWITTASSGSKTLTFLAIWDLHIK